MVYISSTTPHKDEKSKVKSRKKTAASSGVREAFSTSLQNTIDFNIQGTLDELLTDLEEQEKRFLDAQSIYELNRYKAIVQKILKLVLDEGFSTQMLKRKRSGRADYVIINEINEKLNSISMQITKSTAFSLLKTIEEIRGLILDLVY